MVKDISKVAYLGPEGTYTEQVAKREYPNYWHVPFATIGDVVSAVESEDTGMGIIPLENPHGAMVLESFDALRKSANVIIVKESYLEIVHCIGALPHITEIRKVHSKDNALAQCREYLKEHYPAAVQIKENSTAEACDRIKREKLLDSAAIASEDAIVSRGLEIVDRDILPNNRTRFVALAKYLWAYPTGDDKTLISIHPPYDRPGVLHMITEAFVNAKINMDFITSRADEDNGYYFYVEFRGHCRDENVREALNILRPKLHRIDEPSIKVLGSYADSHWRRLK